MLQQKISLWTSAFLQTLCLVQALNKEAGIQSRGAGTPKSFRFSLKQSCDDWAVFSWNSSADGYPYPFGPPHFTSCEITYMNQRSQVAKLVLVSVHPRVRTIHLSPLSKNTLYAASMTCNETITSNTIHFSTGYPCSKEEVTENANKLRKQWQAESESESEKVEKSGSEVSQHPVSVTTASDDYSMMDMALGVFFAMFGVMIISVFAYYVWKKHRHRRRIQRIFGNSHSEPFLALHSPSDQPTTSF